MLDVAPTEDIMITCKSGVTIRMPVSGISEQGRATQGVKLIRIDEGDDIAAITNLDDQQPEEAETDVTAQTDDNDAPTPDNTPQDIA
jgi:DNA gyrase subunit A